MYNNYTNHGEYECCSVILPPNEKHGALLIGDFNSATSIPIIEQHNIKTIITAAAGMDHLKIPPHLQRIIYPLFDTNSENIARFFDESNKTIETNIRKGSVLVHCAAGISRSASLVIAFIMNERKIGFRDAIAIVRKKRKNVCPNLGFERQLKKYEKEVAEKSVDKRFHQKKIASQKTQEDKELSCHQNGYSSKKRDFLVGNCGKVQSKTAEETVRRKAQIQKKILYNFSQNRSRQRKLVKLNIAKNQNNFCVLGQITKDVTNIRVGEKAKMQSNGKNELKGYFGIKQKRN